MTNSPSIKVLILGGGYGTRLQKDIINDASGNFKHLLGRPKALLPIANEDALISIWLGLLKECGIPERNIFIVSNDVFYQQFVEWAKLHGVPEANIGNDGTNSNETRLGAVADIAFGIKHFSLEEDHILVIGGDTLFLRDFKLDQFFLMSREQNGSLVTEYKVSDAETYKFGIMEYEPKSRKVTRFLEKPGPKLTSSRSACPCFYLFTPFATTLVFRFLEEKRSQNASLEEVDATGKFISWVVDKHSLFAIPISGRIDVGGLSSYIEAIDYFSKSSESY
ncbi:uncharacterized protein VTP21DRAFT_7162 [Calcarisporiella thermophila]|uniref:uncharacterized protein n=1 Tax=Calcarisporiella thermophila TaxID=911321 RepID=UPI00374381A7